MSRKFSLFRDYYDNGYPLYARKNIEIRHGVTVLVGCNGIGKTTLLHQMKEQLERENIPYILFDNLHEGGSNSRQHALNTGDMSFLATAATSSEGENIILNMGNLARRLGDFVRTGKDEKYKNPFTNIFKTHLGLEEEKEEIPKERWILLDAIDSGLSVDNVIDIKEYLFETILDNNYGNTIYIVVSANEYEMARGEQCFDVFKGQYVRLEDYEEYRSFIIKSKEQKEKRSQVKEKISKQNRDKSVSMKEPEDQITQKNKGSELPVVPKVDIPQDSLISFTINTSKIYEDWSDRNEDR